MDFPDKPHFAPAAVIALVGLVAAIAPSLAVHEDTVSQPVAHVFVPTMVALPARIEADPSRHHEQVAPTSTGEPMREDVPSRTY